MSRQRPTPDNGRIPETGVESNFFIGFHFVILGTVFLALKKEKNKEQE